MGPMVSRFGDLLALAAVRAARAIRPAAPPKVEVGGFFVVAVGLEAAGQETDARLALVAATRYLTAQKLRRNVLWSTQNAEKLQRGEGLHVNAVVPECLSVGVAGPPEIEAGLVPLSLL